MLYAPVLRPPNSLSLYFPFICAIPSLAAEPTEG
jgi:hypothetical protein